MLVDHVVNRETEVVGNTESLEFDMDQSSMGLIMQGFSDSLYSDKIGSIVREITSNCFDSHIEAGVQDNVDITITENMGTEQSVISFIDYGMGISPERMRTIYSKYGASTKRENNGQIGGWGFGAKVPFAYSNMFEIITRHDGTEYHYILHRGESIPKIELVNTISTTERNGSEVRVPLKNNSDSELFRKAIREQLPFFDNINYHNCGVDNDYSVIKGKHFIVNTKADYINKSGICLGKVFYPLNRAKLTDLRHNQYNSPICLYFDVGELSVTWSRESIEWTDINIQKVEKKFLDASAELQDIQRKTQGKPIMDLLDYVDQYKGKPYVDLNGHSVHARDFVYGKVRPYYYLPNNNYGDDHPNFLFGEFGIWSVASDGSSRRNDTFRANRLTYRTTNNTSDMLDIMRENNAIVCFAYNDTKIFKRTNAWILEQNPGKKLYIVKYATNKKRNSYLGNTVGTKSEREELVKLIPAYLTRKTIPYESMVPQKAWIKQYNLNSGITSTKIVRNTGEIHVAQISNYTASSYNLSMKTVYEQLKMGQKIIYGGLNDTTIMQEIHDFIVNSTPFFRSHSKFNTYQTSKQGFSQSSTLTLWRVNEKTRKLLSTYDNTYTVDEFILSHKRIFKQIYANNIASSMYTKFEKFIDNIALVLTKNYPLYNIAYTLDNVKQWDFSEYPMLKKLVYQKYHEEFLMEDWTYKDLDLKYVLNLLEGYTKNIPFIGYIEGIGYEDDKRAQVITDLIKFYHKTKHIYKT